MQIFRAKKLFSFSKQIVIKDDAPSAYGGRISNFRLAKIIFSDVFVFYSQLPKRASCLTYRFEIQPLAIQEHLQRSHIVQRHTNQHDQ
jgi:hypothetical protein